jgi:ABC-type transport system substrate-binding protein
MTHSGNFQLHSRAMNKNLTYLLCFLLCACDVWNNPYPAQDSGKSILYTAFTERPKHLDPAQAYSENEYEFISNIYAPPLQYHYLKRPYQLVEQAAASMPSVTYLDEHHHVLSATATKIAYSVYEIHIKPGMRYQPHPAFARDVNGLPLYLHLTTSDLRDIHAPGDFLHTGTRVVTALDYVNQIKRLADPRLHLPIYGVMSEYIVGLKDYAGTLQQVLKKHPDEYLDLNRYPLLGVELINDTTYRITLQGKYPQFAYWLAMPFFAPMPEEALRFYAQPGMQARNLTLDWWPVGSGPFYLSENDPNTRMVLSRNPNFNSEYYPSEGSNSDKQAGLLADAGHSLPLIDQVVFTLEKETIPYWNKFLQGYYDASGISSDSFDQAVQVNVGGETRVSDEMKQQGITLSTSVATSTMYTGFNWLDPVVGGSSLRATKLRQAIAIAVDYEEFVSIFANGRGIAAQSPIPPGIFGHHEGSAGINPIVYDWIDGQRTRKSLAQAKRLIAEAGYPDGVDVKTHQPLVINLDTTATGVGNKSRLDWMRKQFDKINIQLVVRSTDYNRFQDKIRRGDTQMFYYGWNADYPDPENFLFLLHSAQAKVAHGGENAANYSNPEYDQLFEKMKNMENSPERQIIIDRMVEILHYDSPWLWGYHPKNYVLQHNWLHNVQPNVMASNKLKYWRVDASLRDSLRLDWNHPVFWPLWIGGVALVLVFAGLRRALKRREDMK